MKQLISALRDRSKIGGWPTDLEEMGDSIIREVMSQFLPDTTPWRVVAELAKLRAALKEAERIIDALADVLEGRDK